MFSTTGRARVLTDAQVRRILRWQRDRRTLVQVARENGVSPNTVYWVIHNGGHYKRAAPLTGVEFRRIREWQRTRKTVIQVARENGVSASTVHAVIRAGGRYKRAPRPVASGSRAEPKNRRNRGGRRARR